MVDVKTWRNLVHLKLSETEFIYPGNRHQLTKCTIEVLKVNGELIQIIRLIRFLGVWLDNQLMMKVHVTKMHHYNVELYENEECKMVFIQSFM